MRNPPLFVGLIRKAWWHQEQPAPIGGGAPAPTEWHGRKTIPLQPENPKAGWSPEHHLAHHLQGMDYHGRNTKGGTGSPEYQKHLQGAHHAVKVLGADQSKLTPQHYSESAQAFPSHIRSNLGKANPVLYIGG